MDSISRYLFLLASLLLSAACGTAGRLADAGTAAGDSTVVTVFYDNDVHCNIDGYDEIAALHAATLNSCLVSAGDFVQGGSLGSVSKGGYIIELMNAAGYDVVTLGNHEFDYGMARLAELSDSLDADISVCNLYDLRDGSLMYEPFIIKEFGPVKVAFAGIATPYSFMSSTPSYFQDERGNYIYSLCAGKLSKVAEKAAKKARRAGADYVIGLTHLGVDPLDEINTGTLVASTTGFDVMLDGHSHSIIPGEILKDRKGRGVLVTSTGDSFKNIGKLTISPSGELHSALIPLSSCSISDTSVLRLEEDIRARYALQGSRRTGSNECTFIYADESSPRLVRLRETPLGDFCADAIRQRMGTDFAFIGGGSIRKALPKGDLCFNDLFMMFPFGNTIAKARMSGQEILDMLEFSVHILPNEFGGFLQLSGLRFEVDLSVPSPVLLDANKAFAGWNGGARRVRNVQVVRDNGSVYPLDPEAVYTVAASAYTLKNGGDGYSMLGGPDVSDTGVVDLQLLEDFITENLGGTIPLRFESPEARIIILNR